MAYKIKSPVMASDVPEALKLIMEDRRDELLKLIIERCTVDDQGNAVPPGTLTLREELSLVNLAAAELAELGNG